MQNRAVRSPTGTCLFPAVALACIATLAATPARSEIYRCTGKSRMPVYQNFPCEFDRLSLVPGGAGTAAALPRGERKPAAALAVAERPSAPRIGMTTDEVRAVWGNPRNLTKEEFAKRDIEVWTYADSRSIEFDRKGIVTAIHW